MKTYRITYDPTLRRPACVILAAIMGGDREAAMKFPVEAWLLSPTPDMKTYEVNEKEMESLLTITRLTGVQD